MGVIAKLTFKSSPIPTLDYFLEAGTPISNYTRQRVFEVFPPESYFNMKYNNTGKVDYPDKLNVSRPVRYLLLS